MSQPSGSFSFDHSAIALEINLSIEGEMRDSQRGKMLLELDLNDPPARVHRRFEPQTSKDVEVIDDDVAIISSRIFAEAKSNSSRNVEVRDVAEAVVEVTNNQADVSTSFTPFTPPRNKRRRLLRNQAVLNWEHYMNSEENREIQAKNDPAVPPSEAPSFNCPICISPMSEETSTKCGHIFCKKCIEAAIKVQHKCPTCRNKLRMKDIIRIYLPTST
ncbi:hypothetical protein UlMin_010391 [Ulmus minor]